MIHEFSAQKAVSDTCFNNAESRYGRIPDDQVHGLSAGIDITVSIFAQNHIDENGILIQTGKSIDDLLLRKLRRIYSSKFQVWI